VKKGPIQGSICFKLVPGFLVPGPLSKGALKPLLVREVAFQRQLAQKSCLGVIFFSYISSSKKKENFNKGLNLRPLA